MNAKQKDLIQDLHQILLDINDEAINDDEFYKWLNQNYFFEKNLEEIIEKIGRAKNSF